jgi:hypothetical protein
VSLRFFAGGGQPPQSHEVLRLEPDGSGVYLTGMPWPEQLPFDEIGRYSASGDYDRLAALTRAAVAEASASVAGRRYADAGGESVAVDDQEASWSPRQRGPEAAAAVAALREVIASARSRPIAVAEASLSAARLTLRNRGEQPLVVSGGELYAGWGPADRPPSPLRLAIAPAVAVALPPRLEPGDTVELDVPDREPPEDEEFATPYALLGLRWGAETPGEPAELAGWLIAGPG